MKIKTQDLIGRPLDWAVRVAQGFTFNGKFWSDGEGNYYKHDDSPSTDWAQGGPIIEQEKIEISFWTHGELWHAVCPGRMRYDSINGEYIDGSDGHSHASTPLIAAMRCYVASKLGDERGGGLWFDRSTTGDLVLRDYDGVACLPKEVATALRDAGVVVGQDFD